jgi:two-component sensor histidine kinase
MTYQPDAALPAGGLRPADAGMLLDMAGEVAAASSVPAVMSAVAWPMRAMLGAGGVSVVLRDGDHCYYAEESAIAPLWKGQRFPLESCISGWCMRERSAAVIADIYRDSRIPHDLYRATFVRSLAMVPLRRDEPIGALGVYWPQLRTPTAEEVRLIEAVGNIAGRAIEGIEAAARSAREAARLEELEHRLKNLFAVVLGLTRLTEGDSVPAYRSALAGRIQALSEVNGELLATDGASRELGPLLRALLRPALGRVRFPAEPPEAAGPTARIARSSVIPLGLAVNELLANAIKHGSLSVAGGIVSCSWRLLDRRIQLHWAESRGPSVATPVQPGLGTRLITLLLRSAGGAAETTYARNGLVCDIDLPAWG